MKTANPFLLLILGLIIFFTGCFSALDGMTDKQAEAVPKVDSQPFTMEVHIMPQGGRERAIAGPSIPNIKNGLYNFIQLVIVDEKGTIQAFDEVIRRNSGEPNAVLTINSIPVGKEYHFLIMIGYWERDYDKDVTVDGITTFAYKKDVKPVLLAAGYQNKFIEGSKIVTITMWPLVIDTKFTAGSGTVESGTGTDGKILPVEILPNADWSVNWNIRRSTTAANGLEYLINAQQAAGFASTDLLVRNKKFILDGVDKSVVEKTTTNDLIVSLGKYGITDIGASHSVNFNLEYIPFNMSQKETWLKYNEESIFDFAANGAPVWIIRNGLNDLPQDANTNFAPLSLGKIAAEGIRYNGNGAVVAQVKENKGFTDENDDGIPDGADDKDKDGYPDDPGTMDPNNFLIYDGKFLGPAGNKNPAISFKTAGYTGTATVYYGIVPATGQYNAANPLPYSKFTETFSTLLSVGGHVETVTLPDAEDEYDIWLMFVQGSKISNRIAVNTATVKVEIDWIWGEEKGGLIIYNLSLTQSITNISVTDSGGNKVPLTSVTPGVSDVGPIGSHQAQGIALDPGTYTVEVQYEDAQSCSKEITIELDKILSWYVSDGSIIAPFGILQVINLSGKAVTSVMAGTEELLLANIPDQGTYSALLEPGTYTVKVKLEDKEYFQGAVTIFDGNITNILVFSDRIVVGNPDTPNQGNNLWILNRCSLAITGVEKKTGSGSYSSLGGAMSLGSGEYVGARLDPNTYDIRVALAGAVTLEKHDIVLTNDPVFLIVQIGSNGQPEIEVITTPGDADGDGFPDRWENKYFGPGAVVDPNVPGKEYDADRDGVSNWDEYVRGTDPTNKDSDHDGLTDWEEINGTKDTSIPLTDRPDTEGMTIPDTFPITDPLNPDTDNDGYSDFKEILKGTDPNDKTKHPGNIIIEFPWGSG
jgi:hypothetical protein